MSMICRYDGIGRRDGLKIRWWRHRVGSSPTTGTKYNPNLFPIGDRFGLFAFFYRYASIYFRNGVSASQPPSRDAPAKSEARAIPERSAGCISFPGHPLRGFIVLSRSVNESTISFIPSYSVSCSASTGFVCIPLSAFIPPCYVYAIASSPKVAVSILAIGILYCFAAAVSLLLSLLKIGGLFYEKILCHTPSQK